MKKIKKLLNIKPKGKEPTEVKITGTVNLDDMLRKLHPDLTTPKNKPPSGDKK